MDDRWLKRILKFILYSTLQLIKPLSWCHVTPETDIFLRKKIKWYLSIYCKLAGVPLFKRSASIHPIKQIPFE